MVLSQDIGKRYAFNLEVLANAHRRGYWIAEVPIELSFKYKLGHMGFKDI